MIKDANCLKNCLNIGNQELENINQVNLKEDETSKSGGDLDENINQSILNEPFQKEINKKQVDINLY